MSEPGETRPAGEGIPDEEMVEQVTGQTASDLKHEDFFEREADGATSDAAAETEDADDVADLGDAGDATAGDREGGG